VVAVVSGWGRWWAFLWAAFTATGHRRRREDRVQHQAFCGHVAVSLCGRPGRRRDGSDDTFKFGSILDQPGAVDWLGSLRGIPRCSDPAAPLSRTDLIRRKGSSFLP